MLSRKGVIRFRKLQKGKNNLAISEFFEIRSYELYSHEIEFLRNRIFMKSEDFQRKPEKLWKVRLYENIFRKFFENIFELKFSTKLRTLSKRTKILDKWRNGRYTGYCLFAMIKSTFLYIRQKFDRWKIFKLFEKAFLLSHFVLLIHSTSKLTTFSTNKLGVLPKWLTRCYVILYLAETT